MDPGNAVPSSSPLGRRSRDGVGASRMLLESRMPEEAKAWGNAQDTPTWATMAGRKRSE